MIWKSLFFTFLAVGAFAEFQVPQAAREKFENGLKEVCTKNGAPEKYEEVKNSIKTFMDCVQTQINPNVLRDEIKEAKPNGALDEVFKKYCAKSPQLKTCIHNLVTGVTPCVPGELKSHIPGIKNATDQILDFVCYKDGDRIALFIAEQGVECFRDRADKIRECVKGSIKTVDEATKLTMKDHCDKFDTLSTCIVSALETCETPTPGDMAVSLLRFIKNGPCKEYEILTITKELENVLTRSTQ